MKKFNFNFKFLDRFKKSHHDDSDVEIKPDMLDDDQSSDLEEIQNDFTEMPRQSFNDASDLLDLSPHESANTEISFSDDNPEVFAEKTLSNYNIKQFQEDDDSRKAYKEALKSDHDDMSPEVDLPVVPEAASRFKIKFPKFGKSGPAKNPKASTGKKLTDRFGESPLKSIDKFSWNDFVLKIFSPYTRGKIHGVFVILLVVTFTYLIGKGAALFLGRSTPVVSTVKSNINIPVQRQDTSAQDIGRITSTNLFNIKESDKANVQVEKKDIASIVCVDAERPTSEPLKLLDTIVLQDSVKSVASVQVRGASDLVNVREGEQLNNTVEVTKIGRMKVILKNLNTGECEYVASENEEMPLMPSIKVMSAKKGQALFKANSPFIKNNGNNFKIKRAYRDKMISNMSEVLTQAKAIQITNPDGSLSFKMTEVVPGSIYSQLDIGNDDIITSINGKKIENLNELMGLLGRIKEIDQFQIGRTRNGMNSNLEFNFE
jgi:type II secretory pathway component PulC